MQSWKTMTSRVTAGALVASVLTVACSKEEKPSEEKSAPIVAPATATPVVTATASAPIVPAPTVAAPAKPHKACPAKQLLAKVADAEECLLQCKTQADCPNKTFCTSGVLVEPAGEHAKLCFKVD